MKEVLNRFQELFRYKKTFSIDTRVFTKRKKQNFKILLHIISSKNVVYERFETGFV